MFDINHKVENSLRLYFMLYFFRGSASEFRRPETAVFSERDCITMDGEERRSAILEILRGADRPVSASALAARFNVSRQIIVGDVALLRASGSEITATPRGYRIERESSHIVRRIACRHDAEVMRDELYAIVDEGCTVRDVIVEHPIYGQIAGQLELSSRHDVDEFIRHSAEADAKPLSMLTEGIHLHTVVCPSVAACGRMLSRLSELGVLLNEQT